MKWPESAPEGFEWILKVYHKQTRWCPCPEGFRSRKELNAHFGPKLCHRWEGKFVLRPTGGDSGTSSKASLCDLQGG